MANKQMAQLVFVAALVFCAAWFGLWVRFKLLDRQLNYINQRIGNPYTTP